MSDADTDPLPAPEDVHPEHDMLTDANAEDWSEEQVEQYKAAREAQLAGEASENMADLAKEERNTLEALKSATKSEADEELTTTRDIGGVEVTVTTKVSGKLESKFDAISDESEKEVPRIRNIKEEIIDAILLLIVDDPEPEDSAYDWQSRATWEAFYMDHGSEGLMQVFETLSEPAMERYEQLGNSQSRTQRSTSSR